MTGPSRQPDDVDVFTGMKPLHGLRSWIFAEGWALTAVGLAGLPYVIAVPNPHKDGVISILVEYVLGVAILILACGRWTFPRVDTAVAVRSDVPVKPPKGQLTTAALTVALLLMLMLPWS